MCYIQQYLHTLYSYPAWCYIHYQYITPITTVIKFQDNNVLIINDIHRKPQKHFQEVLQPHIFKWEIFPKSAFSLPLKRSLQCVHSTIIPYPTHVLY